jgi:phosphatidate cytidylyltransferase
MADSNATLIKRLVSAVLAGLAVLIPSYFGGREGIYLVCTFAIIMGVREFSRMAFRPDVIPAGIAVLFWATSVGFYAGVINQFDQGLLWFALTNVVFLSGSLWLARNRVRNEVLLPSLALGSFGMIFCVLLPGFAAQLAKMEDGGHWFLFLLLVVFFGDTFAYFGGRFWGDKKLMPQVSPSKTIAGSLSGLAGSAASGLVHTQIALPQAGWPQVLVFCIVCGFAAQSGDLLMSLVKRVAHVKDSGGLMPGHGGILDRLDGVFIASPLVYAFALYVTPQ